MLAAFNPFTASTSCCSHGVIGLITLGAVFLAVTGAEALYADLGHFGRGPIQIAWLARRAAGAGAQLSRAGRAGARRSRRRSRTRSSCCIPDWALLPMVVLATAATVIASQAVITGAYSLTRQAIQLGLLPRLEIRHTSETQVGPDLHAARQQAAAGRRAAAGRCCSARRARSPRPMASPSPARWW